MDLLIRSSRLLWQGHGEGAVTEIVVIDDDIQMGIGGGGGGGRESYCAITLLDTSLPSTTIALPSWCNGAGAQATMMGVTVFACILFIGETYVPGTGLNSPPFVVS